MTMRPTALKEGLVSHHHFLGRGPVFGAPNDQHRFQFVPNLGNAPGNDIDG